jgi:hypothetical protein
LVLLDILQTLFAHLACFGITCEHIGTANVLAGKTSADGSAIPICSSTSSNNLISSGYTYGDGSNTDIGPFIQQLKIDLDVRTISRLVEMDAPAAAYDVYRWGRHIRSQISVDPMTGRDMNDVDMGDNTTSAYITNLRDMSVDYHERNGVALAYDNYLESHTDLFTVMSSVVSIDDYEYSDVYVSEVMKGLGKNSSATTTPSQRCVIIESILPLILLHVHALDQFYDAVDDCRANIVETTWDVGFAALTGWAKEMNIGDDNGFLALSWTDKMSTLEDAFALKLKEGKELLRSLQVSCDEAENIVKDIANLMLTTLVDGTAYYADLLSSDVLNKDYLAYGHSVAMALIPLITSSNPIAAATIERNMGGFGPDATPLIDGLQSTMDALSTIVTTSNNTIDCNLLSMTVLCEGGGDVPAPAPTPPAPTPDLNFTTPPVTVDSDLDGTYYPTMVVGGTGSNEIDEIGNLGDDNDEEVSCKAAIGGGLPGKASLDTVGGDNTVGDNTVMLLGYFYQPNSDVSHIVELTKRIELIANSTDELIGLDYYTSAIEDGFSLQCLSLGIKKKYILQSNPMFVMTTYGLWMSELGDNDPDGYSNKLFNGDDILYYGDNIVMDEFDKESGYDGVFSAITIQVMNMWMAMITELYRAAYLCRNEIQIEFSPVDFAAALWFGNAVDKDSFEGRSLYAWAKIAGQEFTSESFLLTAEVTNRLKVLQTNFVDCQILSDSEAKDTGVAMKHEVDQLVKILTVPMVQYFIHYLAIESGQPTTTDTRNHMVLYGIHVLSLISICDITSANDLYTLLISGTEDTVTLNADTFAKTVEILQANYRCLGITCDMVGVHNGAGAPSCSDPSVANIAFAGYVPTSDQSLEILHLDLDIITILSFIVMEADDAALDIFRNGRNAKSPNNSSDAEDVSLVSITTPTLETAASAIYQSYSGEADGRNYME